MKVNKYMDIPKVHLKVIKKNKNFKKYHTDIY